MNKKKIVLLVFALINLVAQIYIYLLHQDKLGVLGIEAIKELEYYILIPGGLLVLLSIATFFIKRNIPNSLFRFTGILSLTLVIYIMSAHTGVRSGVSLSDHPQYIISAIASAWIIVFNDDE